MLSLLFLLTRKTVLIAVVCFFVGMPGLYAQEPISVDATPAPDLIGGTWLNTPAHRPIKLADRRGKVTIVHFWTLGCINCKRNLPVYNRWQTAFAGRDVVLIGVHTPETPGERAAARVAQAVRQHRIIYPVLIDTSATNWRRWHQQYWPTVYLLDKQGRVRYRWEGELDYEHAGGDAKMAQLVEKLLQEDAR